MFLGCSEKKQRVGAKITLFSVNRIKGRLAETKKDGYLAANELEGGYHEADNNAYQNLAARKYLSVHRLETLVAVYWVYNHDGFWMCRQIFDSRKIRYNQL